MRGGKPGLGIEALFQKPTILSGLCYVTRNSGSLACSYLSSRFGHWWITLIWKFYCLSKIIHLLLDQQIIIWTGSKALALWVGFDSCWIVTAYAFLNERY